MLTIFHVPASLFPRRHGHEAALRALKAHGRGSLVLDPLERELSWVGWSDGLGGLLRLNLCYVFCSFCRWCLLGLSRILLVIFFANLLWFFAFDEEVEDHAATCGIQRKVDIPPLISYNRTKGVPE